MPRKEYAMKNIFSFKLYLQGLRKVRTAGVAMAIVIIVSNALFPVLNMISSGRDLGEFDRAPEIDSILFAPFGWLVILFAPLLVYNMFSYLNDRKSSDFFHALPQKRICIYISFMFAVFTWVVGVLVLTTLVNMLLWVTLTVYVLNATAVVMTFLGFLILGLAMAGFMALAMMLTGTATANWLVCLLFFLFVPVCGEFFLSRFNTMVPMFNSDCSWFRIFEVEFFLPLSLFPNPLLYNRGLGYPLKEQGLPFLYWFAVAIVLFALSAMAYCRRRSESATKSAPSRLMQHIYRIGVTFPFLIYGMYMLIKSNDIRSGSLFVLIGVLVWIIFELLTTKKVKNLLKTLPLFLLTAVLAVGGVGSLYVAKNIFYATTPERNSIESVLLDVSSGYALSGWEDALFSKVEIKDADVLDQVYEAIEETKEYWQTPWDERAKLPFSSKITLTLRSGRKVKYDLRSSFDLYATFYRSEEYRTRRLSALDFDVEKIQCNYVEENSMQIWEAFKSDFEALDDAQKLNYLEWNKGQYSSIHVWGIYENHRFQQGYSVSSEYMPNAYRLYIKYYLESQQNSLEDLQAAADRLVRDDFDDIFYANMNIVKAGSTFSNIDCYYPELIRAFLQSIAIDSHLLDVEKAANEEIYQFKLKVIWADEENQFEYTDGVDVQMYLTFSAEDFELYRQIVANGGAVPIS